MRLCGFTVTVCPLLFYTLMIIDCCLLSKWSSSECRKGMCALLFTLRYSRKTCLNSAYITGRAHQPGRAIESRGGLKTDGRSRESWRQWDKFIHLHLFIHTYISVNPVSVLAVRGHAAHSVQGYVSVFM